MRCSVEVSVLSGIFFTALLEAGVKRGSEGTRACLSQP